ncbi:TetR-like C-terminal domain-containing protein [Ktedonobacter racemifer]|uniref:TetR-like C-terminal domain-containing protein n=1 Tax=Ktedonobacter racemifer TaxID=363277 RepID=UPI001B7FB089|nr:TetR-like C-terminal domain-containing protein [Ktedonobacter racemifer]
MKPLRSRKVIAWATSSGWPTLDTDLDFLLDMIYGPMWYRLLNQHAPLDTHFARQLIDFTLKQGSHAR